MINQTAAPLTGDNSGSNVNGIANATGTSFMMGNLMMQDYVSEKMFWVNELVGNDKIKVAEYV